MPRDRQGAWTLDLRGSGRASPAPGEAGRQENGGLWPRHPWALSRLLLEGSPTLVAGGSEREGTPAHSLAGCVEAAQGTQGLTMALAGALVAKKPEGGSLLIQPRTPPRQDPTARSCPHTKVRVPQRGRATTASRELTLSQKMKVSTFQLLT